MKEQLEIDLIVRIDNQVGIIEAKTGSRDKRAIDQLSTAGAREYLGTYTVKFWITACSLRRELKTLAAAKGICVIELPGYREGKPLAPHETTYVRQMIRGKLRG